MKSLLAFIIATVGVALVWSLSSVVPFALLVHPELEYVFKPSVGELSLLAVCYAGGALFWYLTSAELAASLGRRGAIIWTALQTTALLFAIPLIGQTPPMMMLIFCGLGFMGASIWSVWFPLILEVDHRIRPTAVAAFFVILYTTLAVSVPVAYELLALRGSLQTLGIVAGVCFIATILTIAASKKMLRDSRTISPISVFRLGEGDFGSLMNLSFVFLFVFGLLAFPLLLQTGGYLFPVLAKNSLNLNIQELGWIMGIGPVPALAILLVSMPAVRNGVPIRYFGLGMAGAALGMGVCSQATNTYIFVAGYLGYFAGVGLCWSAFYGSIVSAVVRETRVAGVIFAGLGLMIGTLGVNGAHYALTAIQVEIDLLVLVCAGAAGVAGLLLLLGSLIPALNGAQQGGHFDDDTMVQQANFGKFKYGNPRA